MKNFIGILILLFTLSTFTVGSSTNDFTNTTTILGKQEENCFAVW